MANASNLRHLRLRDVEDDSPDVRHRAHSYPDTDMLSASQMHIRIRIGQTHRPEDGADMDLPALIRALIENAKVRQDDLAADLGMSQSSVSRLKNGEQEPSFKVGLRIIELAHKHRLLTPSSIGYNLGDEIIVRGRMVAIDEIEAIASGPSVTFADLPYPIPHGCFAVVIEADGVTWRGRKGDLLIAGPAHTDPSAMIEVEGVIVIDDGRCFYGTLIEGQEPGTYTVLGSHGRRITNVKVATIGPFYACIGHGRWQAGT